MGDADWGVSPRAAELHRATLVWDAHGGWAYSHAGVLEELARWRESGADFLSINVAYDAAPPWTTAIEALSTYRYWLRAHADEYALVESTDDVLRARDEGKLAVAFDVEGMDALNGDPGMVEVYYRLGVRQMLFAYNRNNLAGGGCHDNDRGLTDFGREVIREMNRLGMLVDCSHSAYTTTMEAMEASGAPVIFSHSNARALWDHERNIWDDQIRACAATGGVVGVTGVGRFLGPNGATVEHVIEHIDYMVQIVGPAHVGFGMDSVLLNDPDEGDGVDFSTARDYWPERQYPTASEGYVRPESLPHVTESLLDRGYSDADVAAIMGGNFFRVAREVWDQSR